MHPRATFLTPFLPLRRIATWESGNGERAAAQTGRADVWTHSKSPEHLSSVSNYGDVWKPIFDRARVKLMRLVHSAHKRLF